MSKVQKFLANEGGIHKRRLVLPASFSPISAVTSATSIQLLSVVDRKSVTRNFFKIIFKLSFISYSYFSRGITARHVGRVKPPVRPKMNFRGQANLALWKTLFEVAAASAEESTNQPSSR